MGIFRYGFIGGVERFDGQLLGFKLEIQIVKNRSC